MPFSLPEACPNPAQLVEYLADPHRRVPAYQRLISLGAESRGPARAGLRHRDPQVRAQCCRVLDHVMDPDSIPDLVAAVHDPADEVRIEALHALACDRCKNGSCRPAAEAVLPTALAVLRGDASPGVRQRAAELVGAWAHARPEAAAALQAAVRADPSPAVRKKASWYAPGGSIYRRTAPRPGRAMPQ